MLGLLPVVIRAIIVVGVAVAVAVVIGVVVVAVLLLQAQSVRKREIRTHSRVHICDRIRRTTKLPVSAAVSKKMYKSLVTLHTNGCDFFGGLFEHTFAKKHSVFGDQISSLTSAVHFNAARDCLSAVVPQTAQFVFKQTQTGLVEELPAATEKGKNGQ